MIPPPIPKKPAKNPANKAVTDIINKKNKI